MIWGAKYTRPRPWFPGLAGLAVPVLGCSHLTRACTAEPRDFQFISTYYRLVTSGPDHLSCDLWHQLHNCSSCSQLCSPTIQLPNSKSCYMTFLLKILQCLLITVRMKSKLLIQFLQRKVIWLLLTSQTHFLLNAPLSTLCVRHICLFFCSYNIPS